MPCAVKTRRWDFLMITAYKTESGRDVIRRWCEIRLSAADCVAAQWEVQTSAGRTRIVASRSPDPGTPAPADRRTVVVVPGTNMNSATMIPLLSELARNNDVISLDVPGQPGTSAPERPRRRGRIPAYGRWLDEVLGATVAHPVIVLGHSLGAAIALAGASSLIAGRLLVSPAGITRLAVSPRTLRTTVSWLASPRPERSYDLLRMMTAPDRNVDPALIAWMDLVAGHCRTSLAPGPSDELPTDRPLMVVSGDHDVFLPTLRLAEVVHARLDVELKVLDDCGHLAPHDQPKRIAELLDRLNRELVTPPG